MERAELAEAGVVDENVDGDSGAFGRGEDLFRRGWIVQVGDDDAHLGSFGSEFGGKGFEPVPAAGGEDEFDAVARQFPRQCYADSRTGSSDQRPFAVEVLCVCHRETIIADRWSRLN